MAKMGEIFLRMRGIDKGWLALLADTLVCPASVWLAFYLRLDQLDGFASGFHIATFASMAIALPIFYFSDLYSVVLRHPSWDMMISIVRSVFIYGILFALIFTVMGVPGVPRTIGFIQPLLLFLGIGCWRTIIGYWLGSGQHHRRTDDTLINVVIYGAGASGRQLASAISYSGQFNVVGFVDDAPALQGRRLGKVVIHNRQSLPELIEQLNVEEVLLAIPSASRKQRNQIVKTLYALDVRVRTLPGIMDLASGRVQVSDIRPLDIEDLLGRDVVSPDPILLNQDISGKVILVTGAGGSIGSELCRQILRVGPSVLLLVESNEFALYSVHQELNSLAAVDNVAPVSLFPLLASVRDERRMTEIIGAWKPDTIYHAAAYKHVPLVEHNPAEGVLNNVYGTLTTAKVATEYGVKKFVLISTDKAVRPTNIMGASKRVAEMVLQALAESSITTIFTMVRFGNVLGSSGSVVPLFRRQIAEGGPITITHRDITRYFMTIPEAALLVIQAGAMARGGEVFVLDMGEPVRIIDLARSMIELSGFAVRDQNHPEGDIEINEVGLRPGEKLYEELLIGDNPEQTLHPLIMKANEKYISLPAIDQALANMQDAISIGDIGCIKYILQELVPEFTTVNDVVDWVQLRGATVT